MRRTMIPIILLIILAFEGVATEILPPSIKFSEFYLVSHWLLMFLILVTTFSYEKKPIIPIIYAAIFGLMTDIVYTSILGVYMFVLALSVYVAQLLNRLFQANFLMVITISTITLLFMELSLFIIYSFLGISTMPIEPFFMYRFIPTWIANLLFLSVIYYPTKRLLAWIDMKNLT